MPATETTPTLPATFTASGQTWALMEPGLYMRQHIGKVTAPSGEVFELSCALNGLSIYLETPWDHPEAEDGRIGTQIVGKAMYCLRSDPKAAVEALLEHKSG